MKKRALSIVLIMTIVIMVLSACSSDASQDEGSDKGNYSDEMKITPEVKLVPGAGASSFEREGDHQDSPYFPSLDFYNMQSTDSLTILPKFQTYQQTSEWSCSAVCVLMILNYYGKLENHNEHTLAGLRPQGAKPSPTTLKEAIHIFDEVGGFEHISTLDYGDKVKEEFTLSKIQEFLSKGIPIMICWNDWGGHWQVIIGYDTMGTESESDDVLIVADPYDTTDHNQDGYGVYSAERFINNFSTYNRFPKSEGNEALFIAAWPKQ